ncbi:MAG: hypothetical protein HUJ26_04435 [Planctomycetaceae bacterium]|nr:hypothetical protein [Planctomycetaceae bacterium]
MPDLTRDFLENYGLYRKYHSPGIHFGTKSDLDTPSLQLYCNRCQGVRTFNELAINRIFADGRKLSGLRHKSVSIGGNDESDNARYGRIIGFHFVCQDCKEEGVNYLVLFNDSEDESVDFEKRGHVIKVGQYPAQAASLPQELRPYLKEHEDIYKRGRMCELNGFGLGALAYYRRIIESIIDTLLNDLTVIFADDDSKKTYQQALVKVKETKVHVKKIELVKDLVPDVLKRGQGNPLGFLHEALSVGLHSLTETDCLEVASEIRDTIAFLNKHIQLAREEATHFSKKMSRLEEKLRKMTSLEGNDQPPA